MIVAAVVIAALAFGCGLLALALCRAAAVQHNAPERRSVRLLSPEQVTAQIGELIETTRYANPDTGEAYRPVHLPTTSPERG